MQGNTICFDVLVHCQISFA